MVVALVISREGSDDGSAVPAAAVATDTRPSVTTPASAAASPLDAAAIGRALSAAIPAVTASVTITEDNDPNAKIGRPGGYTDGVVLFDGRADPSDAEPGVDQGAFLEVWPDEAAAAARSEYILSTLRDFDGSLGTEYHHLHDNLLLRVSGAITPADAATYGRVFRGTVTRGAPTSARPLAPRPRIASSSEALTVENSTDLARLLQTGDGCDREVEVFASRYVGRTIKLDGSVSALLPLDDNATRFDVGVGAGDEGPNATVGPSFQIRDVSVDDLNVVGGGEPTLALGDRFRFKAIVGAYQPDQCLLSLEPIATRPR